MARTMNKSSCKEETSHKGVNRNRYFRVSISQKLLNIRSQLLSSGTSEARKLTNLSLLSVPFAW